GAATESVSYAYDDATAGRYGKGRRATMTDPSGSTFYSYERRGLLRSESRTILGDSYTTSFSFDPNGNRSTLTYPSARRVRYVFDSADRPISATGTLGATNTPYISAASYLPFGPEQSLTYASGNLTRSASFDARYRPTGFSVTGGSGPIASYSYGLD